MGYGASILAAVPLIMNNFKDALLPAAAAWAPAWGPLKASPSAALEHVITAAVLSLALALAILIPNVEVSFGFRVQGLGFRV